MRICIASQQIGMTFSGVGSYTYNLVSRLAAGGHKVTLVAPSTQYTLLEAPYTFVGTRSGFPHNHARWFSLSIQFALALKKLERNASFDLIHFIDAREAFFSRPAVPILATINDAYAARPFSLGYYRRHYNDGLQRWIYYHALHRFEAALYPRLDVLIANSEFTRREVLAGYPRVHCPVQVVNYGIDLEKFRRAQEIRFQQQAPAGQDDGSYRVLYAGGNMQRKGVTTLIQSAPLLLKKAPKTEFIIAGRDPALPRLNALCREFGVSNHFNFLGLVNPDRMVELYAQADVFAMPSLTEAFGIVFLEALAAGVPVVATRVGGIPEVIQDGVNGRLVPPDDPPALAEALVEVLTNRELQARFRRSGIQSVQSFSAEAMFDHTMQVYQTLL